MKKLTFWSSHPEDETLLNQVIVGVKTATCTPQVWYYDDPDDDVTEVGDIVAVHDNKGVHRCTIQITENYEIPYGLIDLRVAEGENYITLEEFIVDHDECWAEDMLKAGFELTTETIIVVEHFKLLEVL
jgi:uncharacterized protein YhfF